VGKKPQRDDEGAVTAWGLLVIALVFYFGMPFGLALLGVYLDSLKPLLVK
jgi:hypothetical protein